MLTGPTGSRTMNGDEKSRTRDIEADRAGWVRVELGVRRALRLELKKKPKQIGSKKRLERNQNQEL
jgi:hypothetical protein